ncbi:MAG: anaerobic ribonucleoside-triphosphate reductase activating protein [Pseudobdellovibrionaceae bacterium]|jgi:pyruvate formate lyase activating enzyme|nr:anaerobic ribonucleoside-triphosphate reductase activating protein [Pseudobdellovibrionaceae bacterium]
MMIQDTPVYALTPFTMLDFKDKTACIIWFAGCNMRCAYCHNPDIVLGKGAKTEGDVLEFLERRQGLLDGVVISGGEATCYKGLPALLRKIKTLGYAIKLDSNGTYPDIIKHLFEEKLIDFLALDYKASPCAFQKVTGTGKRLWNKFQKTLDYVCANQHGKFEVRTTIHSDLLNATDINAMISDLESKNYTGTYFIQNYRHKENETLGNMTDQIKELDISLIQPSQNFQIDYRNF